MRMKRNAAWAVIACVWISLAFLIWQLCSLDVLPAKIQVPVLAALVLVSAGMMLLLYGLSDHKKACIVLLVLCVGLTGVYGTAGFYVFKTYNALGKVTKSRKQNENTVSLLVLTDADIESPEDLQGKKIGYLKNIDAEGTDKLLTALDEKYESLEYTGEALDSVVQEAEFLYQGKVDAVVLNEAYRTNITDLEGYEDFSARTRSVFETKYYTETSNEPLAVSSITAKPYTILISGNDTYGSVGELSRSDVNMVVAVDPVTSTVLLMSIPRDSYVNVACGDAPACYEGNADKITHTGIHGITSTKATVERLLGIPINYTFRVNFSSVTQIVDSLGGIDLDVPEEAATDFLYVDSTLEGVPAGLNHLDGARALAFARERYAYIDGDNQRVRNQQMVLRAIFAKATSPDIIVNYSSLLDAVSEAFETNLTREEITDFIKYQIQSMPDWKFESYQLAGEGAMYYSPEMGQDVYVTVLDPATVMLAHDKIEAVLNGQDADEVAAPVSEFVPDIPSYVPGQ